jgi:hypothetical protein
MFGRKKGPDEPFAHADDCKIVRADPGVQIPWVRDPPWSLGGVVSVGSSISMTPSSTIVSGTIR